MNNFIDQFIEGATTPHVIVVFVISAVLCTLYMLISEGPAAHEKRLREEKEREDEAKPSAHIS